MVFMVRQMQEKCLEQNLSLYIVFIDLTKAFDIVNRDELWVILSKLGCPAKFVKLIQHFLVDDRGSPIWWRDFRSLQHLQWRETRLCPRSGTIQPIFHPSIMTCCDGSRPGRLHQIQTGWLIIRPSPPDCKTKTTERLILEALFADDCALIAHQENHLQTIVNRFFTTTKLFGLTISLSRTEMLFQPAPGRPTNQPCITIDGTQISNVNTFKYLGSTIANDGSLDHEINARIQKASQALGRLRCKVLQHRGVSTATKLKVYNAVVLSSLLYGCKTWTLYRKHMKQLEQFHQRSLRSIMRIPWQD
ncbi:uncharacterized protein LOC130455130 [Monodelphis domestica]|uniref:uncharacterized protein LOC130455130 n=1 Tax=Monodelphis domestica TaxID=13616 RepID=UPI0024E1F55E|nr:uncharacterized protein LOC130455130 [Monodelphis domestica]